MSVLRSKRGLSSAQFLENLRLLEQEVLTWCKSQGRKNDDYGLTDLFKCVKQAYSNAVFGNQIFLKTAEEAAERKGYFDESIRNLHLFNAELTALSGCYNISNSKIKRWMEYVYKSITQMESIKKSDIKRIKG